MRKLFTLIILGAIIGLMAAPASRSLASLASEPIVYTLRFPSPDTHQAEVEAVIPSARREKIELLMPIWSPGFYRIEEYASRIQDFSARAVDGAKLEVEQPTKNRWLIRTNGADRVILNYRLLCNGRSVTTNWVGDDFLVLNGAATFITLVEKIGRPHDVKLELPSKWNRAMTALETAPGVSQYHFRASDYDTLVDSPIVAGNLAVREFDVNNGRHYFVDVGASGQWNGERAAQEIEKVVRETQRFWGFLPFKRYVFLNVTRQGGGGLEHKNSTLLTMSPSATTPTFRWLAFVSHEYFHAFNVKRLRPIELSTFDYERPPQTGSLWISEGLTSYYGELIVCRAGLGTPQDCLNALSSHISQLQSAPGRLLQTLDQSSLDVWTSGTSGVGRDTATKISYYIKGPVVGFLLDAKIRAITNDRKSLDDVMRLAYKRYSGTRGFTPEQFRKTTEEVAGVDLSEWFRRSVSSVEELDYTEALDWFGLRFAVSSSQQPDQKWKLELRDDVSDSQRRRQQSWLGTAGK